MDPDLNNGRILIVDDDQNILEVLSRMIDSFGLEPISCTDVPSAVATYRSYKENKKTIAAVIMDLTIPGGVGGQEAVKLILDCDPNAKVIVSSGYSDDPVTSDYARYGFAGVLPKPYDIDTLSKVLQDAMNRS
ncbi:response regulator [bacterium]|nr:response regulator [bacterium]